MTMVSRVHNPSKVWWHLGVFFSPRVYYVLLDHLWLQICLRIMRYFEIKAVMQSCLTLTTSWKLDSAFTWFGSAWALQLHCKKGHFSKLKYLDCSQIHFKHFLIYIFSIDLSAQKLKRHLSIINFVRHHWHHWTILHKIWLHKILCKCKEKLFI